MLAKLFLSLEKKLAPEKALFVYPGPATPRTAVLVPWFSQRPVESWLTDSWPTHPRLSRAMRGIPFPSGLALSSPVRMFREGWCVEVAKFEPAAIAGTFQQFQDLMGWRIPSLTHAVIVLTGPGGRRLIEQEREQLWRAFHVPVFEQVIGPRGELLAAECEAHDGLHVESPALSVENEIVHVGGCLCGKNTPRIGVVEGTDAERRVAAYAR